MEPSITGSRSGNVGRGRQFVVDSPQRLISAETRQLVDKLLLERLSLAGIVRATGVSARWLQYYVNRNYATTPRSVNVTEQKKIR